MTIGAISAPQIIPLSNSSSVRSTIDTNTLIEIRSDRNDVDIYYTLDGTKPDSLLTLTTRKSTLEYRRPFYIPRQLASARKVTIKAIVVSNDGVHESAVTTKTFNIHLVPSDHPNTVDDNNRYLHQLQDERQALMQQIQEDQQLLHLRRSTNGLSLEDQRSPNFYADNPTDSLRCAHCFAPKSTDPYARYCTECGRTWQKLTHTPKTTPIIRTCTRCDTTIPFNYEVCVVCETPASVNYQAPVPTPPQAQIICPHCKTANPAHHKLCSICQSSLIITSLPPKRASTSVPSVSSTTPAKVRCLTCNHYNHYDARFCYWCGTTVQKQTPFTISCTKCQAQNDSQAKFCHSCGCVTEMPLRLMDARMQQNASSVSSSMIASTLNEHAMNSRWLSAKPTVVFDHQSMRHKTEAATQTYGLYYPNAKDLDLVMTQNKKLLAEQEFPQPQPRFTAVSPGKGYWKKQIDHVYTHLQAYATKRPEFQSIIGEPLMSDLVHANVQEGEEEVTIQVVFRKPKKSSEGNAPPKIDKQYPATRDRSLPFSHTFDSDDEYLREAPKRKKSKTRSQSPRGSDVDQDVTRALLRLLEERPRGQKRRSSDSLNTPEAVQRLLEKGADANGRNGDGFTMLQLAVRNGHYDCLPILIKDGKAKLDKRGGPRGDTPLHDCCLLGSEGVEPLSILLRLGGDPHWLNGKKESVVDLASKQNCPELLQVIGLVRQSTPPSQSQNRLRNPSMDNYRSSKKNFT